ncbi:MAG: hypothetical protein JNJ61_11720 [Anaerolineae bacterium]|nr:hypothetical protein [Anaerolineae bacterium]
MIADLRTALTEFKGFLDENVPVIRPAINAIASLIPQINELLDKLVELMNSLKAEVQRLDVSNIPGLDQVSEFTGQVTTLLETTRALLPAQEGAINEVLSVAGVVGGLPELNEAKAEIIALIDAISAHLNSLKSGGGSGGSHGGSGHEHG